MPETIEQAIRLLQSMQGYSGGVRVPQPHGNIRAGEWATSTGTTTSQYLYGVGGLFGTLGLERDVISTRIAPRGIAGRLPAQETNVIWPEFPYLVGFTNAQDGSDVAFSAQGVCDDGPVAGQLLGCTQTAQFGFLTYDTEAIDIGRVGQQVNRGQFRDLRLVNSPLGTGLNNITPDSSMSSAEQLLQDDAVSKMMAVGVAYQNKLVRLTYTGNPANNNAGGAYKEFLGLDHLISINHRDAHTKQLCRELDSLIVDYHATAGDPNISHGAGLEFVNNVTWMYRMLNYKAERTGLAPVNIVLSMRQAAFWEATAVWACAYWSYRCATNGDTGTPGSNVIGSIDVRDSVEFRDSMRNGNYLLIDGSRVEVVIDDGIVETNASGTFTSNIYFLPLSANGSLSTLYWQFYDYSAAVGAARTFNFSAQEFWTDGGRFLWIRKIPRKRCIQLASEIQPRLVLRTPHLAGVLQGVSYTPLMHEPSALAGDVGYLSEGVSVYSGYGPSLFDNNGNPIVP